jgi:hypothetical protein
MDMEDRKIIAIFCMAYNEEFSQFLLNKIICLILNQNSAIRFLNIFVQNFLIKILISCYAFKLYISHLGSQKSRVQSQS